MQPEDSKATSESLEAPADQNTAKLSQHGFDHHDERASSLLHPGAGLAQATHAIHGTEPPPTNDADSNPVAQDYLQRMSSSCENITDLPNGSHQKLSSPYGAY